MRAKLVWVLALLLVGCQNPPSDNSSTQDEQQSNAVATTPTSPPPAQPEQSQAEELTPEQQSDVWKRIAMQFTLDIPDDPSIDYYRNWYIKHPNHLKTVSKRAEPFLYLITTRIEDRGLPLELTLLPVVESAFDPFAYSWGSAAGLWQFVPMTAERFGLEINYWYDGRRDVDAATDAALDYMTYLGNRFDGNWNHAIAAYNSGGGRVSNSIRRNKNLGKPTDFFSLELPKETRGYVPKLLALAQILSDPDKYGVEMPAIPNRPYLEKVDPGEQLDLAIAAQYAGMSVKELQSYNPGFNQWATAPDGPYAFLIPLDHVDQFKKQAALNKGQGVKLVRYKVQAGDSLSVIASKNQTTTKVIQEANGMDNNNIRVGQYLMVPRSTRNSSTYSLSANNRLAKTQSVARGKTKTHYTVKSGDTFWSISRKYSVGQRALAQWNGMAPNDSLQVGKKLVIWQNGTTRQSTTSSRPTKSNSVIRTVFYSVRSGDTLSDIADKFGVHTQDIITWNQLYHDAPIQPGQKLKLEVDVTQISA